MKPSSSRTKKLKTKEDAPPLPSNILQKGPSNNGNGKNDPRPSSSKDRTTTTTTSFEPGADIKNPLENLLILNHFFKCCPPGLLATCRLVSKQWYQESLATWRSSCQITFTAEKKRLFMGGMETPESPSLQRSSLQDFLAYCDDPINKCSTKPYRSIKLQLVKLNWNYSYHLAPTEFGKLWTAFGTNLTSLHLRKYDLGGMAGFWKMVYETCPNLRAFNVDDCDWSQLEDHAMAKEGSEYKAPLHGKHQHLKSLRINSGGFKFPITWLELFSHFQSLTHFAFTLNVDAERIGVRNSVFREFKLWTNAVRIVRGHDPKALPFTFVELDPPLNISQCDRISQQMTRIVQELRLPLKYLRLKVESGMSQVAVKDALQFHANMVTEMKVTGTDDAAAVLLSPPFPFGVQLDKLKILEIPEKLCGNMSLFKYTPSLKQLVIAGGEDSEMLETRIVSDSCKQDMANVKMVLLEELRLEGIVMDNDLESLFQWMPYLTSLEIPLNDEQFSLVCGNWKSLTHLSVKGRQLTDAGITGTDNLLGGGGGKGRGRKKKVTPTESLRPNIADLQNLEEFACFGNQLTKDSVFRGFLRLPRLRKITFPCRNLDLGSKAREALEKRKILLCEPSRSARVGSCQQKQQTCSSSSDPDSSY